MARKPRRSPARRAPRRPAARVPPLAPLPAVPRLPPSTTVARGGVAVADPATLVIEPFAERFARGVERSRTFVRAVPTTTLIGAGVAAAFVGFLLGRNSAAASSVTVTPIGNTGIVPPSAGNPRLVPEVVS